MDSPDPYATAKANLRDNVKTLATIIAGVAGLVLAGSPFSGLGALSLIDLRFFAAIAGLAVAAIALFVAWRWLIFTLTPDINYSGWLKDGFTDEDVKNLKLSKREEKEIFWLRDEFKAHKKELIPEGFASLDEFDTYLEDEWKRLESITPPPDKADYLRYLENFDAVAYWAAFARLQYRVRKGINVGQYFGLAGIIGLVAFAWAANPKKEDGKPLVVRVEACGSCASPKAPEKAASQAARVEFETNVAKLDAVAFMALRAVAADLRAHPSEGVLLMAHTDTVASDRINRSLAVRRADSVYAALVGPGGIAANRVFMSPLPKVDLPVLTGIETAQRENRSVELLTIELTLPVR